MNTLTMALAVVLLAGTAPEEVSGETRQMLDLRGEWEGTMRSGDNEPQEVRFARDLLLFEGIGGGVPLRFVDDGAGKLRILHRGDPRRRIRGTYRQEKDRVVISMWDENRPIVSVLTLHCVKPHKRPNGKPPGG